MAGARDYSTTADSNLSVGGISLAEGWARASVNNAYRAGLADIANLLLDQGGGVATTGSSNAYLLDLPTAPTAYADNLLFVCKLHAAVTGASTINVNGLGVKPLQKLQDGVATDLVTGDGPAGHRPVCVYSSADNAVLMLLSAPTFTHTGGETWSITDRMKEQVYLLDFIPQSEHAAIRNGTSTYDCSDAWEAAQASISVPNSPTILVYVGGPEVIFPYGKCYFDRTIEINKTMTLTGYGQGGRSSWATCLEFKAGITGIVVNYLTTFEGDMNPPTRPPPLSDPAAATHGGASTIRNLKLISKSGGSYSAAHNDSGEGAGLGWPDPSHHGVGHGIWMRSQCLIENCMIQHFPQHGIYIHAGVQASVPNDLYGNCNLAQIYYTACLTNGGCGLYIDGPDTNACLFYGMDIASNRLSGIHESSLIGNTHIMHHTDLNGRDGLCSYSEDGIISWRYYVRDAYRANNNAPAWAPTTAYRSSNGGQYVRNSGNLYRCSLPGTTAASGGPTGTGVSIVDGTARWDFVAVDAGIRIPPAGHAQSEAVWAKVFPATSQAHPDPIQIWYPTFPGTIAGGAPVYRLGFNFWFDQVSARNVLVGPYVESNMPYSLIKSPSIVIGSPPMDAASNGIVYSSSTNAATIAPALEVIGKNDATNTRDYSTDIGRNAGESLGLRVFGDGGTTLATASSLAWVWDELTGTWIRQHARNGARIAQRLTTTLNNITGGRADPIGAGNTLFTQGVWLGRHPTYTRHFSMAEAMPTTGQWAAGDLVLNALPLMGEPWGWRCILTGDFAATPPVFQPLRDTGSQQSIADVQFTLTPGTSPHHTRHTGSMTANRAVTLSTTAALQGLSYRITRTSGNTGGPWNLTVGTGPLKSLAVGEWCEVVYDGSAYYLSAFGAL